MANINEAAWQITRLFLLPDGEFISRPAGIVYAETEEQAIDDAAQAINGIAILKARKLTKETTCPVCGHRINAQNCRPMRQDHAAKNDQ